LPTANPVITLVEETRLAERAKFNSNLIYSISTYYNSLKQGHFVYKSKLSYLYRHEIQRVYNITTYQMKDH